MQRKKSWLINLKDMSKQEGPEAGKGSRQATYRFYIPPPSAFGKQLESVVTKAQVRVRKYKECEGTFQMQDLTEASSFPA
eukprot:359824-Pelagomonas_calceolata.AAC.4